MKKLNPLAIAAALFVLPMSQASAYLVNIYDAAPMTTLAQADAAIAAGSPVSSSNHSVIEFDDLGDGTRGRFSLNNAFPGGINTTFAARITGNFVIDTAGMWTFGINHDDGARLMIDGTLVASGDGVVDNRDTFITGNFAAGLHTVEIVYFENSGGASLEFFGRQGGANSTMPYALVQSVPEPSTLALLGVSLAGFVGARRKRA
jgi:PA14 domain/PEP-CTERM motif